jgi:CRP-like cAMP-binding protein
MSGLAYSTPAVGTPPATPAVNKLLASLPADDLQRLRPHLRTIRLRPKQVLHKQGEKIRDVYFPTGGACSIIELMQDGQAAEIATVGDEGMLGGSVYFGQEESFTQSVVQVPGQLADVLSTEVFNAEMSTKGALFVRAMRYQQALMTQIMQTTVCNGLHSAEQRCCRWLLMMHDRVKRDEFPLTHETLAMMLGVRRPTITLIAAALQRAGFIHYRRGYMKILSRTQLAAASCECYQTITDRVRRLMTD